MSVTLSNDDLAGAAAAIRLLLSPLGAADVDGWRSAVNCALRELLDADSAGFILPLIDGPLIYSDEHDPSSLARYPELLPPLLPGGKTVFAHAIERGVTTLEEAYDGRVSVYLESAYYRDYAGANGAHDTLSALIALRAPEPRGMAGIQFWHASPTGRRFGEREAMLLRLVFPALTAGVETQVRWHSHRQELLDTLDRLGHPVLACAAGGRVLHQTPALTEALAADPEGGRLRSALIELARLCGELVTQPGAFGGDAPPAPERALRTDHAEYVATATFYRAPVAGVPPLVLVALVRTTTMLRTEGELRARYGLTPSEMRVAALIARGRSGTEIARALHLSPHTVRRHTERILTKTAARSRSELVSKILR
jgi:DNA-binding CsgD family transcriptional regulator